MHRFYNEVSLYTLPYMQPARREPVLACLRLLTSLPHGRLRDVAKNISVVRIRIEEIKFEM